MSSCILIYAETTRILLQSTDNHTAPTTSSESAHPPNIGNENTTWARPSLAMGPQVFANTENISDTQGRFNGEWTELWNTGAGFLPDAPPWSIEETLGLYDFDFATQ